jgi:hypothetical protein
MKMACGLQTTAMENIMKINNNRRAIDEASEYKGLGTL